MDLVAGARKLSGFGSQRRFPAAELLSSVALVMAGSRQGRCFTAGECHLGL